MLCADGNELNVAVCECVPEGRVVLRLPAGHVEATSSHDPTLTPCRTAHDGYISQTVNLWVLIGHSGLDAARGVHATITIGCAPQSHS